MPYSSFTLEEVKDKFTLKLQSTAFFPELAPIAPSDWLAQTLGMALPLAQTTGSEKARSEFIIAPILLELRSLTNNSISVFSGEDFTVDSPMETLCERELGLSGICDFLISQTTIQFMIDAPVLALVEAQKGVLRDGWGQCIAEMVAAKKFNENRGKSIKYIYGIVTSGSLWHFFQMQGDVVLIDPNEYSLLPIDKLLAALKWMVSNDNN
jgi:hypothetical protein